MKISEAMTRDVVIVHPDQMIQEAARMMMQSDIGLMPVGDENRLLGMLSDRDIAVRAVAAGLGPDTSVREVMTEDVKYCFEEDDADEVARSMGDQQIRRIPVVSQDKRLVGIVSLCDLVNGKSGDVSDALIGQTLGAISRPGGYHSQQTNGSAV